MPCGRQSLNCRLAGGGSRPPCPGRPAWTPSPAPGRTSLRPASALARWATSPGRISTGRSAGNQGGQRRHPVPHSRDVRFAHELVAGQASRRPGSAAVIAGGPPLTYRELDQSANQLAHYLRELGAGPETLIGVYLERGVEAIRSLLAIMKAGCGYLPLDPSLPANRLARICEEARPMAILAGPPAPQTPGDAPPKLPRKFSGAGTRLLMISGLGRRPGAPAGHGARGQPAPGHHVLRDPHLGIHRPAQGGRGQLRQPGLRHQ